MKPSRSDFATIHGLRIHVRRWGTPGAPRMFLVHGWKDCSATFQFVVDAFKKDWDIIAPDLRGMGLSEWQHSSYWFADYVADLDRIFDLYAQDEPALLVGHSMGASICSVFAGLRPARIARLVFLEGYGVPPQDLDTRPGHFEQWLDGKKHGMASSHGYGDRAEFTRRLLDANPRLTPARAEFLATHFTCENAAGRLVAAVDPWHRLMLPTLASLEDLKRIWRRATAPLLWVVGTESHIYARFAKRRDEYLERLACFHEVREVIVPHAAHNIQHDRPEDIAALIEQFVTAPRPCPPSSQLA